MFMPQRYLHRSLYVQSQVFYPCLLIVCFKVLFECSPPFLTFELHSKIKFVTLTNALFVTMMTNGKQILKKNHHNAIRCLDLSYPHLLFGFLKQIENKRPVIVNILYKHRTATVVNTLSPSFIAKNRGTTYFDYHETYICLSNMMTYFRIFISFYLYQIF